MTAAADTLVVRRARVFTCTGTACLSLDSGAVKDRLQQALGKQVEARGSCCLGLCARGPLVRVEADDGAEALYERVQPDGVDEIAATLAGAAAPINTLDPRAAFFTRQVRIVTANAGRIDPESIEDYLAVGGYDALSKASIR